MATSDPQTFVHTGTQVHTQTLLAGKGAGSKARGRGRPTRAPAGSWPRLWLLANPAAPRPRPALHSPKRPPVPPPCGLSSSDRPLPHPRRSRSPSSWNDSPPSNPSYTPAFPAATPPTCPRGPGGLFFWMLRPVPRLLFTPRSGVRGSCALYRPYPPNSGSSGPMDKASSTPINRRELGRLHFLLVVP
jgi:hypothetical protein